MMREAKVIMPREETKALDYLQSCLADTFGGWTRNEGAGAWCDGAGQIILDDVYVYNVGVSEGHAGDLLQIAAEAKRRSSQDAVYVRLSNGEVEFV